MRMTAIILFPAERRLGFIRRQVASVADYKPVSRERTIAHQLRTQRDWLSRLGVDPGEADAYVATLRAEIEARLPDNRRSTR
jgi:hypothetical protein